MSNLILTKIRRWFRKCLLTHDLSLIARIRGSTSKEKCEDTYKLSNWFMERMKAPNIRLNDKKTSAEILSNASNAFKLVIVKQKWTKTCYFLYSVLFSFSFIIEWNSFVKFEERNNARLSWKISEVYFGCLSFHVFWWGVYIFVFEIADPNRSDTFTLVINKITYNSLNTREDKNPF